MLRCRGERGLVQPAAQDFHLLNTPDDMAGRSQQVQQHLTEAVQAKNWNRVAEICEQWELEVPIDDLFSC